MKKLFGNLILFAVIAAVISFTKNNWSNKTGQLVQPADVAAARK